MKVKEFIDKRKVSKAQSIQSVIEAKKYLSFIEKQNLVNKVLDKCQVTNNGYTQFDEIKKYIVFTIEVIQAYTNLEFDADFDAAIAEYDALCEADLLNSIIETFEGEYKAVLNMVTMKQDYILQNNSIECQVAQFLNNLNEKLDMLAGSISESFGAYRMILKS